MLLALTAMWGSTFMFNKLGVASIPPATVVAVRVVVGLLTLLPLLRLRGLALPPPGRIWVSYTVMALLGNAVPFYFITWGQQVIDSALAGITISIMPIATLVLAHFFVRGEHLTWARAGGFALGFAGIVLLFDPAALARVGIGRELLYQLAVLVGALCYAGNSVAARLLVSSDFLVAAAGTLLVASIVAVPVALIVDRPWQLEPTVSSLASVIWIGVGPTGIATVLYFRLISSAGPTFMSLVNYLSPGVAVLLGVALLGEEPGVNAYAGLALILAGIALSQSRQRKSMLAR
ncbi:MAG TPA: DMT family transporter [Burkholderiales bacterium]|nr:DMT family transporter [Burkholderiales bacterium]